MAVSSSRIDHPLAGLYSIRVPGRVLVGLRLAPWKRYYDTRNRLFIAKKYYGFGLYTQMRISEHRSRSFQTIVAGISAGS